MTATQTSLITLACRHCGGRNRFPADKALLDLGRPSCGKCAGKLLRVQDEPLGDLLEEERAHPRDREALAALRKRPRCDDLLAKVMGRTVDKIALFRFTGGAVQADSEQLPTLWKLHTQAAARLCIPAPPLFVVQSPQINAFTGGSGQPFVVLTTALVDAFDDDGVLAVLAHELTHVRLGHTLYRTLARLLVTGGVSLLDSVFAIGGLLIKPIEVALLRWYQVSELSADRGALLVTADLQTHIRTEMMIAGGPKRLVEQLSTTAFVAQAARAEAMREGDLLLRVTDMLEESGRTHPLPTWRVHHVATWAESAAFFQILAGVPRKRLEA